jgi:hypothetical protein
MAKLRVLIEIMIWAVNSRLFMMFMILRDLFIHERLLLRM